MLYKALAYIMILLIAVQSVVAVVDSHQLHQSGSEHLSFEHSHDQAGNKSTPDKSRIQALQQSVLNNFDCHHCCHCHGVAQLFLPTVNDNSLLAHLGKEVVGYLNIYLSFRGSPDNPPPIS